MTTARRRSFVLKDSAIFSLSRSPGPPALLKLPSLKGAVCGALESSCGTNLGKQIEWLARKWIGLMDQQFRHHGLSQMQQTTKLLVRARGSGRRCRGLVEDDVVKARGCGRDERWLVLVAPEAALGLLVTS